MRELAALYLRRERPDHTLQPTALVHEAWLRLATYRSEHELSPHEYRALAAQVMRRVLTDHARRRSSIKRDGERQRSTTATEPDGAEVVLDVHAALEELALVDSELALIVELRFFGGLSLAEIAEHTGLSVRTVKRRWQLARAWLADVMAEDDE